MIRQFSNIDRFLMSIDNGIKTLSGHYKGTGRAYPAQHIEQTTPEALLPSERKHAGALMRINYTGEVCAQALYQGQALFETDPTIRQALYHAAAEENDHLDWCHQRISALDTHTSYLNPLWYMGAFSIGVTASLLGHRVSMGFLMETEKQVAAHLESHLDKLPQSDQASRAIVSQMKTDELEHAQTAQNYGAAHFAKPIQSAMKLAGKVMTSVTYYV